MAQSTDPQSPGWIAGPYNSPAAVPPAAGTGNVVFVATAADIPAGTPADTLVVVRTAP